MTQELFQPEIGVKNGLDGKIRLARAEARSLVAKRSIFKTVAATAADMGGGKGGGSCSGAIGGGEGAQWCM